MEAERRRFTRKRLDEPVRFEFKDPGRYGGCLSADISQGGIRINFNEFVPLGTDLYLKVQISPEKVVDCVGKVVWVEKHRFLDRYQVGVEFDSKEFNCIDN